MRRALVLVALLVSLPASVAAQRHHHEHHEFRNEMAFFAGVTTEDISESPESYFSFGGEYEYRFLPRLGVSAEAEFVTEVDSTVVAFPVVFHAYRGLMFLAGPGWESAPRVEEAERERSFLFRVGMQYAFHLGGRYSIIPSVDFDFVRKTELEIPEDGGLEAVERVDWGAVFVWGVKFGISF